MPRVFMVKKVSVSPGKRNWSQLPDHERGEIYVPASFQGLPLGLEQSEASPAESAWCDDNKHTQILSCSLHLRTAELPSCSALCHEGQELEGTTEAQEGLFLRSRIKVTTGELPGTKMLLAALPNVAPGESLLICQVCQKEFRHHRMLKRHLKCHSETKRHQCSYCGKGFNDTFDLKRHVRTHTGVRPYKCSQCDKGFTQRCSLESHMKKIHGLVQPYAYKERRSKLYVCEECGLTAPAREALRRHLEAAHPKLGKLADAGSSNRKDQEDTGPL